MMKTDTSWSNKKLYEEFMGKWSLKIAKKFIDWLKENYSIRNKKWLDVGCGTGALTFEIAKSTQPISVLGIDPSMEYLPINPSQYVNDKIKFNVGFGDNLSISLSDYDFVVSALALNFMSDKQASILEMLRILKPNGIIALYVWDYAEKMEFLRYFWNGVVDMDPDASKFDEGQLFPICNIEALTNLFSSCNVNNVITNEIEIKTRFNNFNEYWYPFLGGQGPAGKYLQTIDNDKRNKIRDHIKEIIPISKDGSINLIAKAFAISGVNR